MPTALLDPDIQAFIARHARDDVAALALSKMPDGWPRADILNQIKARQKARIKIPSWADIELRPDIVFPAPDLIEQASSQAYKRYECAS